MTHKKLEMQSDSGDLRQGQQPTLLLMWNSDNQVQNINRCQHFKCMMKNSDEYFQKGPSISSKKKGLGCNVKEGQLKFLDLP